MSAARITLNTIKATQENRTVSSMYARRFMLPLLVIFVVLSSACERNRSKAEEGAGAGAAAAANGGAPNPGRIFRGRLGKQSWKIRREGDKTYLWAGGAQSGPEAHWYDFTSSPIPASDLQFGIGKDRIASIDDPMFVSPNDPRLMKIPGSPYRPSEQPHTNDEIPVIGYVQNGEARAYPVALLDHHELVNDRIGGKPVTVGW